MTRFVHVLYDQTAVVPASAGDRMEQLEAL